MSDTSKKNLMIGSIVGAVVIGGAAIAMVATSRGEKAAADTPVAASPANPNDYIQSDAFDNLTPTEKVKYFADNRDNIDRDVMRKLWQVRMNEMVEEWYALPEDQREAFLDEKIDEWEEMGKAMREQREARSEERAEEEAAGEDEDGDDDKEGEGDNGRSGRGGPDRAAVRDHVRERTENVSPEQRAKSMAFFQAMMARRAARGMPGWGGRGQ